MMTSKRQATESPTQCTHPPPPPQRPLALDPPPLGARAVPVGVLRRVVLPCQRVLTTRTVQTAVDKVPGDGPVEVWVHPGTRSYGMWCFAPVCTRVTAVRVQAALEAGCKASCQLLRRLVAAIGMYEPSLIRQIRLLVPDEPANAKVGTFAFTSCELLASVFLPPYVTSISQNAFYNCFTLTTLVIPDSVASIGHDAFYNCVSLTTLVIPDSVASIGHGAFHNCVSLTTLVIPDSVASIGHDAFYYCVALRTVVIPESVTSIGDGAFGCTGLESVTIPDAVTSIGVLAFANCKSLTSVTIPSAITLDTDNIFFGCPSGLTITRR
jgi:hypothetical protein